ncbi:hypothetical protein GCM10010358_14060 [Streptomyces minutiscleroticus]|uniref:Uncharacterized protein n=1 Tax=Streptomyces minutiscleroticus TaxID=68238 RepID=A0A918NBP3_9ACTN|nr:hypothetical protein GCM10010358_14060 [Streptomyces minutiscleroticus]
MAQVVGATSRNRSCPLPADDGTHFGSGPGGRLSQSRVADGREGGDRHACAGGRGGTAAGRPRAPAAFGGVAGRRGPAVFREAAGRRGPTAVPPHRGTEPAGSGGPP